MTTKSPWNKEKLATEMISRRQIGNTVLLNGLHGKTWEKLAPGNYEIELKNHASTTGAKLVFGSNNKPNLPASDNFASPADWTVTRGSIANSILTFVYNAGGVGVLVEAVPMAAVTEGIPYTVRVKRADVATGSTVSAKLGTAGFTTLVSEGNGWYSADITPTDDAVGFSLNVTIPDPGLGTTETVNITNVTVKHKNGCILGDTKHYYRLAADLATTNAEDNVEIDKTYTNQSVTITVNNVGSSTLAPLAVVTGIGTAADHSITTRSSMSTWNGVNVDAIEILPITNGTFSGGTAKLFKILN